MILKIADKLIEGDFVDIEVPSMRITFRINQVIHYSHDDVWYCCYEAEIVEVIFQS